MAQGVYRIGEHIDLVYHSAGDATALTPTAVVYDETATLHVVETTALNSSLAVSGNKKSGGAYLGGFQPDAEGDWTVVINDGVGGGNATKMYRVCGFNIDALGDAQIALESGVKSAALITQSAVVSSVKSATLVTQSSVISSLKSAILILQSALASSAKSAVIVETSDLKSAVLAQASDVKSAVLAISSPASVS